MKILFDANEFHPSLRADVSAEVERLQRQYPPFIDIPITTRVPEHAPPQGYVGLTQMTRDGHIPPGVYLSPDLFGPSGNMSGLREEMNYEGPMKGFHGSLTNPVSVVTHEYGHVVENSIRYNLVGDAVRAKVIPVFLDFMAYFFKGKKKYGSDLLSQKLFGVDPETVNYFGTGYAATHEAEYFAETFALLRWGTPEDKALKSVQYMQTFLMALYPQTA